MISTHNDIEIETWCFQKDNTRAFISTSFVRLNSETSVIRWNDRMLVSPGSWQIGWDDDWTSDTVHDEANEPHYNGSQCKIGQFLHDAVNVLWEALLITADEKMEARSPGKHVLVPFSYFRWNQRDQQQKFSPWEKQEEQIVGSYESLHMRSFPMHQQCPCLEYSFLRP